MATKVFESNDQALSTIDMWEVHQKELECGLTELAVTGKAFNELCRIGRMKELLLFTRIYARFTPEDKVQSISSILVIKVSSKFILCNGEMANQ